jgi:hypothetical protein
MSAARGILFVQPLDAPQLSLEQGGHYPEE